MERVAMPKQGAKFLEEMLQKFETEVAKQPRYFNSRAIGEVYGDRYKLIVEDDHDYASITVRMDDLVKDIIELGVQKAAKKYYKMILEQDD